MIYLIILCGLIAIAYSVWSAREVLAADAGSARMQEISAAVQEGATAYLRRQYTTIAAVGVVVFIVVAWFLSITVAHRLPDRRHPLRRRRLHRHDGLGPRQRAHRAGGHQEPRRRPRHRLPLGRHHRHAGRRPRAPRRQRLLPDPHPVRSATRPSDRVVIDSLVALGFGASLISIFARLGGGIFTKGADVGADLVGKVEAGIPEDDPRNPATIADNVGDNVGDCAGMAADLFETYAVTVVATMVLASIFFAGDADPRSGDALSAGDLRRLHHHLDRRHLLRQARRQQFDHGRALQGPDRHRRPVGRRSRHRHLSSSAGARSARLRRQPITGIEPVHLRPRRPRRHRPDRRDHRVLHRHRQAPGGVDRPGFGHRPRHQRHPGPRRVARIDGAAGARHRRRHHRRPTSSPACSAPPSRSPPCSAWPA